MKKITRRRFLKQTLSVGGAVYLFQGTSFCSPGSSSNKDQASQETIFTPGYKKLEQAGLLSERVEKLYDIYKSCILCPRECGANRLKGEKGICRGTSTVKVSSAHQHFGEERALVGKHGSGTVFFSNCNLRCVFCINYQISIQGNGNKISDSQLASLMLGLQKKGCRNINIVTPTHYVPNMVRAVQIACKKGLTIPLTYNTSGYERVEILKLLDGIIDIYLPDLKYMESQMSGKYSSGAFDYPECATAAIKEMYRQVGDLKTDASGNALRGLILRHLVMPNNVSNTDKVIKWIADNLSKSTYVNIMAQYRPMYKAFDYPKIARRINRSEFTQAIKWAREAGLTNLDKSSLSLLRFL
jgi:putative pyruvate formate lyase activating enzyme